MLRDSSGLYWNFQIIIKIIEKSLKTQQFISVFVICVMETYQIFELVVVLPTKLFLGGIKLQLFNLCDLINDVKWGNPSTFDFLFRHLNDMRVYCYIFLGGSIFLSLTLKDVMASNMDLWATLTRVKSIQKGNSNRQYVMA